MIPANLQPMDQAILEREAMLLSAHERALLADALIVSLDDEAAQSCQAAWALEAEERRAAHLRGEIASLSGPDVLREIRGLLST
jgi:hypothetical protein